MFDVFHGLHGHSNCGVNNFLCLQVKVIADDAVVSSFATCVLSSCLHKEIQCSWSKGASWSCWVKSRLMMRLSRALQLVSCQAVYTRKYTDNDPKMLYDHVGWSSGSEVSLVRKIGPKLETKLRLVLKRFKQWMAEYRNQIFASMMTMYHSIHSLKA